MGGWEDQPMRYLSILVAMTLPLAAPAAAELLSGAERAAVAPTHLAAGKSFGPAPRRGGRPPVVYPTGPADPVDVAAAWAEANAKPAFGEAEWRPRSQRSAALERRR